MRGTHPCCISPINPSRIIPAYAGNTLHRPSASPLVRDHPRVCGEHELFDCRFIRGRGSSPRMRGTPPTTRTRRMRPGIIPAYAGNTRHIFNLPKSLVDHPRVCGEHVEHFHGVAYAAGSSPRMRGTHPWRPKHADQAGIIPAYAGNTIVCARTLRCVGDHPRVCGEHGRAINRWTTIPGSSPRMRGTLEDAWLEEFGAGIIPAYAGNTSNLSPCSQ